MKNKLTRILMMFLISALMFGQEDDDFAKRLKGINNQNILFFNVDGVNFSTQTFNYEFNEKSLKKLYRKYSIKDSDVKTKDELLSYNNFFITRSNKITEDIKETTSYYFIEDKYKTITIFSFGYYNNADQEFERRYINRILNNEIPKDVYESVTIDSIDFAGRKIKLGNNCYWTNVNTVQCPYYGEMNWSIHKTYQNAKDVITNQLETTRIKKGGKVISEQEVPVIFEGTETNAKKIKYGFTGTKSLLVSMSGGKELTIYYVACKVRDNYVSCCMSFWNNDTITESGLTPLLDKIMQLKK
ncbi:hypothetical protein SAMN05444671_3083 [Flavobacterium sp. CF108]|uniref:hypothetical protein n=1 Tax=unclassified Flavobacterium TaxID=196869 RepID=UPI0008BDDB35|nr:MULTISPECIES: hypothetical protein [unclassified Flavobacterium]SEP30255.1 hypothetical protein SAMN04487978_0473 [Flavobacterium sp. fv08]SHH53428.1 hypothetical protein SAMN05444671_3083 [Flavobacterium sp. CF108]